MRALNAGRRPEGRAAALWASKMSAADRPPIDPGKYHEHYGGTHLIIMLCGPLTCLRFYVLMRKALQPTLL